MDSATVLGIAFEHPADWKLDVNAEPTPHAWTAFVLSHAASLNCVGDNLAADCAPSLQAGGVLVWWTTFAWHTGMPDGGETITVDSQEARLFIAADECDRLNPQGTGLERDEVDRAAGVAVLDGTGWLHAITACFRDPAAEQNLGSFLDMLATIDLPNARSGSVED